MADLNLAFEIVALQNAQYRITVQSQDTEWTIELASPFTADEERGFATLRDPQNASCFGQQKTELAIRLGQHLFAFLIDSHPQLRQLFHDNIVKPGVRIRLLLETKRADWLNAIPWELLYSPPIGFLALSPKTPIVRANHELSLRLPAPVISPLKVLAVIAAPPNYPYMNIDHAWKHLQELTATLQASGLMHIERLERATWPALKRRLRAEDFQVLHYIGFSQVDVLTGQAFLALEDDSYASASYAVSGIELGHELGPESTIRLAYLNIHEAPAGAPIQLASQLLKSGLPSVITTQFGISAASEQLFTQHLYPPLCEAHPVDAALNVARLAVAEHSPDHDWAAPALFLRTRDSMLFRHVPGVSERLTIRTG